MRFEVGWYSRCCGERGIDCLGRGERGCEGKENRTGGWGMSQRGGEGNCWSYAWVAPEESLFLNEFL